MTLVNIVVWKGILFGDSRIAVIGILCRTNRRIFINEYSVEITLHVYWAVCWLSKTVKQKKIIKQVLWRTPSHENVTILSYLHWPSDCYWQSIKQASLYDSVIYNFYELFAKKYGTLVIPVHLKKKKKVMLNLPSHYGRCVSFSTDSHWNSLPLSTEAITYYCPSQEFLLP